MGAGPSRRRRSDAPMYPPRIPVFPPPPPPPPPLPGPSQMYSLSPSPGYGTCVPSPPLYQPPRYPNGAMAAPHYYPPASYSDVPYRYPPPYNSSYLPQPSGSAPPNSSCLMIRPSGNALASQDESPQQQNITVTIRNLVNIQKGTIRLEKDEENPGFHLLAFSFDADLKGSISIFLFAKEAENCSVKPLNHKIFNPIRIPFEKGYGQKFKQAPGTGIYLDAFDDDDLDREGPDEVCPLVIRAQASTKDEGEEDEEIGDPLPKSGNAQMTQAVIERKNADNCKVRVLRQVIWVDGVRYELKELYGIENAVDSNGYDEDDFGKECVICLSEPRDTAVLPCRHLCMCNGCAKEFKSQMSRCPICRQIVDSFLKIRVNA